MSAWHTHDLPQMRPIDTPSSQLAFSAFRFAEAIGKPTLFHGEPGTGKGMAAWLIAQSRPDLNRAYVKIRPRQSDYAVGLRLAARLRLTDLRRSADLVFDRLVAALATSPPILVVIDEAQFLIHEAAEYLRALGEETPPHVLFLYLGGHRCVETLSKYKGAYRRLEMAVEFRPLDRDKIVSEIPNYHPLWSKTGPELIGDIYDRIDELSGAGGVLGEWAKLTRIAIQVCARQDLDTIDLPVAQTLFTLRNWPWAGETPPPPDEQDPGEASKEDVS